MKRLLRELIDGFECRPAQARTGLKHLVLADPDGFQRAAIGLMLRESDERVGVRYLSALLLADGMLWRMLEDSDQFNVDQVVLVIRRLMNVDPALDSKLIQMVLTHAGMKLEPGDERRIGRMLEILSRLVSPGRMLPLLARLVKHDSPQIRSKVALLIGRANRNVAWLKSHFLERDARVRANAVEALWDGRTTDCAELFLEAATDHDNRVAGNAAVGLYRYGHTAAIRILREMARHAAPAFRATAAWAMGETGDPRFLALLAGLASEALQPIRRNALRARTRIRARQLEVGARGGVRCHLLRADCAENGERTVVAGASLSEGSGLGATHFVLEEDGEPVWDYAVERVPAPEGTAVAFAVPRSAGLVTDCMIGLLDWKARAELWTVLRFDERGSSPSSAAAIEFVAERAAVTAMIRNVSARQSCASGALEAANWLANGFTGHSGERHVIVFVNQDDVDTSGQQGQSLGRQARRLGVRIHGIRLDSVISGWLDLAAEASGGIVETCGPEELPGAVEKVLAAAGHSYEFRYRLPAQGDGRPVRVEINCEAGTAADDGILSTQTACDQEPF